MVNPYQKTEPQEKEPIIPEKEEQEKEEIPLEGIPLEEEEKPSQPPEKAALQKPAMPAEDKTLEKSLEGILSEDISGVFGKLDSEKKKEVRTRGRETVAKITGMIKGAGFVFKKIFILIKNWLKLIPGLNKFFVEQEAKIKTEKIIHLTEKKQKEQ